MNHERFRQHIWPVVTRFRQVNVSCAKMVQFVAGYAHASLSSVWKLLDHGRFLEQKPADGLICLMELAIDRRPVFYAFEAWDWAALVLVSLTITFANNDLPHDWILG